MERNDPDLAGQTLRRLEERLDRASDAAERLIAEATARATRAKPPPAGWQAEEQDSAADRPGEAELLVQALQSLRDLVPPDLRRRLAEALRELLLAVRALLDWYIERLELRRGEPVEVQDIPIV
jgi:hypothetical protein